MPEDGKPRRRLQISLLSVLLLTLLVGASVGVYLNYEAWTVVLHVEDAMYPGKVALTPDGKRLALSVMSNIELWDVPGRRRTSEISLQKLEGLASMAFTPDTKSLLSTETYYDEKENKAWSRVTVRDAVTLHEQKEFPESWYAALSPDQAKLLLVTKSRGYVLDYPSGNTVRKLAPAENSFIDDYNTRCTGGLFSPDGRHLAIYEIGGYNFSIWDPATATLVSRNNKAGNILDIAFAGTDTLALVSYTTLNFLNLKTGQLSQRKEFPPGDYRALEISPDASRIAVMSFDDLRVYNYPELVEVAYLHCPGASKYCDIAMSRDGTTVAISSLDFGEAWVFQRQRPEGPLGLLALPQSWIALFCFGLLLKQLFKRRQEPQTPVTES